MKKSFLLLLMAFLGHFAYSQEELVVGLHYVTVKTSDEQKLIDLEKNIFSKLHKNTINEGRKVGYDLWRVINDDDNLHTTFIYAHLEPKFKFSWDWDKQTLISQSELALAQEKWRNLVVKDHIIITTYKGGFAPVNETPVSYALLGFAKVDPTQHYNYEQMEINDFMPYHKANKLVKGWGLHKIVSPTGENDINYITANFFESMEDIYENNNNVSKLSGKDLTNYKNILKVRTITNYEVSQLVLSVR